MSNQEILAQLRAHGYRVRVTHRRYVNCMDLVPNFYPMAAVRMMGMGKLVDPRGGVTEVGIVRPGAAGPEHEIHGVARCSFEDNFVQMDGLRMAFVDALAPESDVPRAEAFIEYLTFDAGGRFVSADVV